MRDVFVEAVCLLQYRVALMTPSYTGFNTTSLLLPRSDVFTAVSFGLEYDSSCLLSMELCKSQADHVGDEPTCVLVRSN